MSVEHNATGSIPLLLHSKSKPVDDVEYEEEDGEGDQEKLVNPEIKVEMTN